MNYPNLSKVQGLVDDYGPAHHSQLIRRFWITMFLVACVAGEIMSIPDHPNLSSGFRLGWIVAGFVLVLLSLIELRTFQTNKMAWEELQKLMLVAREHEALVTNLLRPMYQTGLLCTPEFNLRNAIADCLIDKLRESDPDRIDFYESFLKRQSEPVKIAVKVRCREIREEATRSLQEVTSKGAVSLREVEKHTKTIRDMDRICDLIAEPKPLEWVSRMM